MRTIMNIFQRLAALAALGLALPLAAQDYQVGERLAAPKAGAASTYRTITFDDLMPLDWDPNAVLKQIDLGALQDNDPRANALMDKIREAWNQAPVVPALGGQQVRIAGFLVRLEGDDKEIREFLLVPYFGACIHVPPPPVNQVVHVVPAKPVPAGPDMGAVWVSGTLRIAASKTDLGDAGYRIDALRVEPYREDGQ
jgi:hypothetical protein